MANPNPGGNVYKRDTPEDLHEAWNAVIRKVNDERGNPPEDTDCEALSPIEEVEPDHIWTKQNIEEVRDAIDEMCEYTWEEDLEYWKDEIIAEIEEALDREWGGWGDEDECCEEECIPACSDCGDQSPVYEVVAAEGCLVWPMWQCMIDYIQWKSVRPAALAFTLPTIKAVGLFSYYHAAYCRAYREVEDLEEELEQLEEQLAVLEAARDEECAKPPPNNCVAAQEAVDAKQDEVDEKQEELDEKKAERDEYEAQKDSYSDEADSLALAQAAVIEAASHPEAQNMWPLVTATNHPWVDQECEFKHGPRGVERCQWRWSLAFQSQSSEDWNMRGSGLYTPNGIPFATHLSWNPPFSHFYCVLCCWGYSPDWCNNPASTCGQAEGTSCPLTWRVSAYSDPTRCYAYDSGTGAPC